jgi:hypothetical protein
MICAISTWSKSWRSSPELWVIDVLLQGVPKGRVVRRKRATRYTIWRKPPPPRPPEPASTAPAERFEGSISKKNLDARPRHRMNIEERLYVDCWTLSRGHLRRFCESQAAQEVGSGLRVAAGCEEGASVGL